MSNLSRKVKKATEPFKNKIRRSKRKYQKRVTAIQKAFPWPSINRARIPAFEALSAEQKQTFTTDLGVFDLDAVNYVWTLRWEPGVKRKPGEPYDGSTAGGWYPTLSVNLCEKLNENI